MIRIDRPYVFWDELEPIWLCTNCGGFFIGPMTLTCPLCKTYTTTPDRIEKLGRLVDRTLYYSVSVSSFERAYEASKEDIESGILISASNCLVLDIIAVIQLIGAIASIYQVSGIFKRRILNALDVFLNENPELETIRLEVLKEKFGDTSPAWVQDLREHHMKTKKPNKWVKAQANGDSGLTFEEYLREIEELVKELENMFKVIDKTQQ